MDSTFFIGKLKKISLWHVVPDIKYYHKQEICDFSIDVKWETINDNLY